MFSAVMPNQHGDTELAEGTAALWCSGYCYRITLLNKV